MAPTPTDVQKRQVEEVFLRISGDLGLIADRQIRCWKPFFGAARLEV